MFVNVQYYTKWDEENEQIFTCHCLPSRMENLSFLQNGQKCQCCLQAAIINSPRHAITISGGSSVKFHSIPNCHNVAVGENFPRKLGNAKKYVYLTVHIPLILSSKIVFLYLLTLRNTAGQNFRLLARWKSMFGVRSKNFLHQHKAEKMLFCGDNIWTMHLHSMNEVTDWPLEKRSVHSVIELKMCYYPNRHFFIDEQMFSYDELTKQNRKSINNYTLRQLNLSVTKSLFVNSIIRSIVVLLSLRFNADMILYYIIECLIVLILKINNSPNISSKMTLMHVLKQTKNAFHKTMR